MADRRAVRVLLALHADDVSHLLFHQLGHHPEPDTHAEREQPLLRSARKLAERLLHSRRQLLHLRRGWRDRYVLLHGGSSLDLERITTHALNENGRGGGTAVSRSTNYGTTSRHEYNPNGAYLEYVPSDRVEAGRRVIFETDGQRVTYIRAGKLPAVRYVEGCA